MNKKQIDKLTLIVEELDENTLIKQSGERLITLMTNWDNKMMQRKSKAYDDVENFRNKFLADYLFILDEIKGDIPNVSEGVLESLNSHDKKWEELKKEIDDINEIDISNFNNELLTIGMSSVD